MDVTAAEAAKVTSRVEVRLQSEATSGMAEETATEACDWAAVPQPARLSSTLPRGGTKPPAVSWVEGSPGGRKTLQ